MEVTKLAPGLWRWTARHPDWTSQDAGHWGPEVGSVYAETAAGIVLIDPLVPGERAERERFWQALDRDVDRLGSPQVLLTLFYHSRSAAEIGQRYGSRVWLEASAQALAGEDSVATDTFRAGDRIGDVRSCDARRCAEVVYWLPSHCALVAGDVLLGRAGGGVRVCPDDWMGDTPPAAVRTALRALLDLPVELVVPAHGEPVLEGGREALARALA